MLDTWDLDLFALTTTDICGAAYLVFERAGVVELCGGKQRLWAFINAVRNSYEAIARSTINEHAQPTSAPAAFRSRARIGHRYPLFRCMS